MDLRSCKNCSYYYEDQLSDGYCCNDKSPECTNYVERDNKCAYWEQRIDER